MHFADSDAQFCNNKIMSSICTQSHVLSRGGRGVSPRGPVAPHTHTHTSLGQDRGHWIHLCFSLIGGRGPKSLDSPLVVFLRDEAPGSTPWFSLPSRVSRAFCRVFPQGSEAGEPAVYGSGNGENRRLRVGAGDSLQAPLHRLCLHEMVSTPPTPEPSWALCLMTPSLVDSVIRLPPGSHCVQYTASCMRLRPVGWV